MTHKSKIMPATSPLFCNRTTYFSQFQGKSMLTRYSQELSITSSNFVDRNSGFTPHRSTIDRIATLKLILQRRREFQKLSWVAGVRGLSLRLRFGWQVSFMATSEISRHPTETHRPDERSLLQHVKLRASRRCSVRLVRVLCRGSAGLQHRSKPVPWTNGLDNRQNGTPRVRWYLTW